MVTTVKLYYNSTLNCQYYAVNIASNLSVKSTINYLKADQIDKYMYTAPGECCANILNKM